jgi:hypothetical protein
MDYLYIMPATVLLGAVSPLPFMASFILGRFFNMYKFPYKIKQHKPPSKKKTRGKNLSPRNRKACHSIRTALLQSITEIGTKSTTKSSRKTLQELSKWEVFPVMAPSPPSCCFLCSSCIALPKCFAP